MCHVHLILALFPYKRRASAQSRPCPTTPLQQQSLLVAMPQRQLHKTLHADAHTYGWPIYTSLGQHTHAPTNFLATVYWVLAALVSSPKRSLSVSDMDFHSACRAEADTPSARVRTLACTCCSTVANNPKQLKTHCVKNPQTWLHERQA